MSSKEKVLKLENKRLKEKVQVLEKEVFSLKSKSRPLSSRVNKTSESFNIAINSNNKAKFDESSIERNTSKNSWSKLINTELDILKDLTSPKAVCTNPKKSASERVSEGEIKPKFIKDELKKLKEENKHLKIQLRRKAARTPRSDSKISKKQEVDFVNISKNIRGKHCKICAKLLSKGYTTRYCPTHGHSYKAMNNSYLT